MKTKHKQTKDKQQDGIIHYILNFLPIKKYYNDQSCFETVEISLAITSWSWLHYHQAQSNYQAKFNRGCLDSESLEFLAQRDNTGIKKFKDYLFLNDKNDFISLALTLRYRKKFFNVKTLTTRLFREKEYKSYKLKIVLLKSG